MELQQKNPDTIVQEAVQESLFTRGGTPSDIFGPPPNEQEVIVHGESVQGPQANEEPPPPQREEVDEGWNPRPLPDHLSPEDAYGAATYWQSQRDKALNQLDEMKRRIQDMETAQPISKMILDNPDLLQQVSGYLSGSQGGQPLGNPATAGPQQDLSHIPEPPQLPDDLDPFDESSRKALKEYFKKQSEYNQQVAKAAQAQVAQRVQQMEMLYRQQEQQKMEQQYRSQLVQRGQYEFGMSRQESEDWVNNFLANPEVLNDLSIWAKAYRLHKGETVAQPALQARNPAKQALRVPPTAAQTQGSEGDPQPRLFQRVSTPDPIFG